MDDDVHELEQRWMVAEDEWEGKWGSHDGCRSPPGMVTVDVDVDVDEDANARVG